MTHNLYASSNNETFWDTIKEIFPEGGKITRHKIWRAFKRGLIPTQAGFQALTEALGKRVHYVYC